MIGRATANPAYPSRRSAYYVGFIVFFASVFSFLDRQILAILVEPIQQDLQVSDTGISLLYGFAFVILYSTLGLPIGRLIDRKQRRLILAAGVLTWSVMTVLCGLATDYWTLFGARLGVGVGEACLTPAACSLLADCFEPRTRGRAMSFYLLGVYVGVGLSMAIGGVLFDLLSHAPPLPIIGELAPWRAVFVIVGAPGLLIGLLVLTMKEPARQDVVQPTTIADGAPEPALKLTTHLSRHRGVIAASLLAQGALAFASYGLMAWGPSVLIRQFALPSSRVGLTLGLLATVGCIVGALGGSFAADRWTTAGIRAAKFQVCAVGGLVAALGLAVLPLTSTPWATYAAIGLVMTALSFASGSGQAMVQEMFPNRLRGQGSALVVLLMGILGTGFGPLAVGLASDHLFGKAGLALAIAACALPAVGLAIGLYFQGRDAYEALRRQVLNIAPPATGPEAEFIPAPRTA